MTIEVPNIDLGAKFSSEDAALDFAVGLYTGRRISMGKAARIASISYPAFLRELGRRGICVNFSQEDFERDLKVMETVEATK